MAMPNASSLFHDTLLNKINDLIKLHVRFIDNKIRKQKKTLTAINLINPFILFFNFMMVTLHGMNISNFKKVQTKGCFANVPRQCCMEVVNQLPCYRIGALASIL